MDKWDERYLKIASEISFWSKDPSSGIGAIAVGKEGQILSQGYNGFPRGILDSHERYEDREKKYSYIVHAEMNLIFNSCLTGVTLKGSTFYISGLPICSECAKGIIQVGVKRVVTDAFVPKDHRWYKSCKFSEDLFEESGIIYKNYQKRKIK